MPFLQSTLSLRHCPWAPAEHSDPEYLRETADAIRKGEYLDQQKEKVREVELAPPLSQTPVVCG